jgi:hypothetical protein
MNLDFLTPSGVWNPILWLLVIFVALLVSYLLWLRGNPKYKKGTEQTKPFLSGYAPESKEAMMVSASNIYWGFATALKGYYEFLKKMHTGDVRDYLGWYVGIVAIMLILYILWGGA